MKPVLRALVWLGLGGGIGFFAGWQFGEKRAKKEALDTLNEKTNEIRDRLMEDKNRNIAELKDRYEKERKEMRAQYEAAVDAVRSYKGYDGDTDGDSATVIVPEEEPEMPMDEPEMPEDVLDEDEDEEEEIPQLHPQDILPHAISKGEFLENRDGYDIVDLDYYTDDDVIFDPKAEEKWTHPEQLLGIGWKTLFISAKGLRDVVEVYIQNDTMETLYKITRIDDSFAELYEEE